MGIDRIVFGFFRSHFHGLLVGFIVVILLLLISKKLGVDIANALMALIFLSIFVGAIGTLFI